MTASAELLAVEAALDAVETSLDSDDIAALDSGVAELREGLTRLPPADSLSPELASLVRRLHERSEAVAARLQERLRSLDLVIASWREAEEAKDERRR
jgi:hypothetical protein